jgi:hypothetical protein
MRDQIDFEIERDEAKPGTPDTEAVGPKRQRLLRPNAREPFWWAVASMIGMVAAFVFVLFVSHG